MKSVIASLVLVLAGSVVAPSFAADAPAPAASGAGGAVADACHDDIQKLCPGVQPGEGRVKDCMKEHRRELSKECKQALKQARRSRKGGGE
jgi:hypothetical protein